MDDGEKVASGIGDLVVVGSSAGGVEALSILVHSLPADFPAPIVLAQHLDPNRQSSLDMILQRRTRLPVEVVQARTHLKPGNIYVVPANRHVIIDDSHIELQNDHSLRPQPSVDRLLSSAAEMFGERLIAVILTGSGSDGATGAMEVKNAGGTVIVQNPKTARYPSMPLALLPAVVDFEEDIERIGPLLYELLTGPSRPTSGEKTEDILRSILEQVNRQASIDFRSYKTSTILRRISRRMAVTRCQTMRDYLEYLRSFPEEVGELVKSFLINVTQFFRDPDAFAYLKSDILPKLIARARERDHILRFWTAGCATGEEPYSLAMLITELLSAELSDWSIKIFATDLDEAAISFARKGLYSESLLKGMPEVYKERFFERTDNGCRVSKTLRQMVIFGQQDLSRSAPFPRIDLVLCRNVLIYFTPELQDYVLNQFAFSLSPGGYIFLGKAETVRPTQPFYELVNKHWKMYLCRGNALPLSRRPTLNELRGPRSEEQPGNTVKRNVSRQHADQEAPPISIELGQLRRFNELLLRFFPIGVVVIDRSYHVLTANPSARRILGLREITSDQDFLHAVRGIPYTEVRNAIDAVFREHGTLTLPEVRLDVTEGGSGRYISFSIAIMQMETNPADLAAISVTDVTEQIQTRRQLEAVQSEQTQLMHELGASNKRLNDVNKELLDANEELQVANEELVLTHEELQASIEEFETTNEELQATNEELETNNEELQATNEELETTNDELRARTSELQEMAILLESERVQLSEMVELSPFYIMVLRGPNLLVEAFNPRYAGLLKEWHVQGRPLEVVFQLFWEEGVPIVRMAHEAYLHDTPRTTPRTLTRLHGTDQETTERYFVYNLVPSHDSFGKVSGVIIYAIDETEQRLHEDEEERERIKLIFDNTNIAVLALYDAQTLELLEASPRYLELIKRAYSIDPDEALGQKWQDIPIVASLEQANRMWQQVMETYTVQRLPEVSWKPSQQEQETVWDCTLTPILDKQNPQIVRYMLVSAIEITEQALARQEVERLNRLRDNFLYLASHELRNPLTSILGNAELLQSSLKHLHAPDQQKQDVQRAQHVLVSLIDQGHRLNGLISDILDITRIQSEQFELKIREQVDLIALIRSVVEQQQATSDHPVILEMEEGQLFCTCDESRIEQVLNNLISNATKYSTPGKPVVVGVCQQADEAVVFVRDEGIGMTEEEQAHIFERFYRAHALDMTYVEGLGLGLYIAHSIVAQHDGRMWVESTPGTGSTFYFSLGMVQNEREPV